MTEPNALPAWLTRSATKLITINIAWYDDMTILMCGQKQSDASLIYCTEPKTKTRKMTKLKKYSPWQDHGVHWPWGQKVKVKVKLFFTVCIGTVASNRPSGKVLQWVLTGAAPVSLLGLQIPRPSAVTARLCCKVDLTPQSQCKRRRKVWPWPWPFDLRYSTVTPRSCHVL